VFGASILDKCRADLLGIGGDHLFAQCALDSHFWKFTGLDPEEFRAFVATGADDEEVGEWIERNASVQDRAAVRECKNLSVNWKSATSLKEPPLG
jgi:hypothetical protein